MKNEDKEFILREMLEFYEVKDKYELAEKFELSRKSANNWPNRLSKDTISIFKRDKELKNLSADKKITIKNNDDNIIMVPFYSDCSVSAGFGSINYSFSSQHIPFNKQELRLMFNIQGFLKLGIISVIGDSMHPTIKEGEMIIFQDDGSMIEGGIYVVEYQNEIFVKRLKKRPLCLMSDNKEYPPIEIGDMEEIKIIGRVVGTYNLNYKRL